MRSQQIIKKLLSLKFQELDSFIADLNDVKSSKDVLYRANCYIFESSSIDHNKRLKILSHTRQISLDYDLSFCTAHNLTLSIKVAREIGENENLIKDSHKVIELWKKILDEPLAINGLIFAYVDLGLIFSDYNLNTLALEYMKKAESIISECEDDYTPSTKLFVAYAVVYSRINDYKKSNSFYRKVLERAKSKNDFRTQIPILLNMADYFIKNYDFNSAKNKCEDALKLSRKTKDQIYRPYIYNSLGLIYLNDNQYKKSENYLDKASSSFHDMNITKMIPRNLYFKGKVYFRQKQYNNSLSYFSKSLEKNRKLNNIDLDIKLLKKICKIYKHEKEDELYLSALYKLNQALEKHILNKEKVFSDTSANALKHLSQEFHLSLIKEKDLKAKFDVESKKRKLITEALVSVSEKEFLKKIINRLSTDQIDSRKVVQLCKQRMNDTKDWDIFMKLFNDIHPQFNKYIINKCSNVTESELRVCNLIKMGFSGLEISDILSISKRGVEQHRYRIRKKLNLSSDLTMFIHSL